MDQTPECAPELDSEYTHAQAKASGRQCNERSAWYWRTLDHPLTIRAMFPSHGF